MTASSRICNIEAVQSDEFDDENYAYENMENNGYLNVSDYINRRIDASNNQLFIDTSVLRQVSTCNSPRT